MSEKMPTPKTPEELLKEEGEAHLALWLKDHPETPAPKEKRECGPEVAEFETMIQTFETEHPLEALHAIIDLTPEESKNHPIRTPARLALNPILKLLQQLEKETNITPEINAKLRADWKRINQAVGMINANKVDHTR